MAETPVIAEGDLRLVPFSQSHLTDAYVSWLNDPDTVRYSELRHHPQTMESCRSYLASMRAGANHFWAIESRDETGGWSHVGNVTAYIRPPNGYANLAILIGNPLARGQGWGRRAWAMACDWLLGSGGLRKVGAGTMACNAAMLSVARAAGMEPDGIRRDHYVLDGRPIDLLYFARFRR